MEVSSTGDSVGEVFLFEGNPLGIVGTRSLHFSATRVILVQDIVIMPFHEEEDDHGKSQSSCERKT